MSLFIFHGAVRKASADEFDTWLRARGGTARDVVIAVYNARSGKRTVTLEALQETALCHGSVDTENKRIDDEGYAIRFVPRRAGSTWGPETDVWRGRCSRKGG